MVESNAPIDENTEQINDLPESLRQTLCWDLANHGTITLGQMRQIDSEFCDRLLSKNLLLWTKNAFFRKVFARKELKQSFARYQGINTGRALSHHQKDEK